MFRPGDALETRPIDTGNGKLTADATGEVENEEGVVQRVYPMRCSLYRTLHNAIQLTSSFELVAPLSAY
jgi:hypothetical protein